MPIVTIDKFSGGLNLTTVIGQTQQSITDCEDILNVEFYPRGTISQREGYKPATVTASTGITRLMRWAIPPAEYQLGCTCASGEGLSAELISVTMGTTPSITVILSAPGYGGDFWNPAYDDAIDATSYCGSAFFTYKDSATPPIVYNGSGQGVASSLMSGCAVIEGFGNYLFVGNYTDDTVTRYGSTVRWNVAEDATTWPASYYLDLDPDDGDEITCMKVIGEYLVVFKKRKIFIVYWTGGAEMFTAVRRFVTVGCVGPNAAAEHEGKLIFLSEDGVYSFDGTAIQEISTKIRTIFQHMNTAYYHLSEAFEYLPKKQIWFTIPYNVSATVATTKNYTLVWDYELNNWTKFDLGPSAIANFCDTADLTYGDLDSTYGAEGKAFVDYATVPDFKLHMGFLDGHLHEYGQGTMYDDAAAIASTWKSTWIYPGQDGNPDPITNKRLLRATLLLERKPQGNLLLDLQEDWKDDDIADSAVNWTGTASAAMTGTSTAALLEKRIDGTRYARAFQVVLSGDLYGNPWTLHRIMLDILPKGRTFVT